MLFSGYESIRTGCSLVEDYEGHESPWWLASDPHGSQMASFIRQIDPRCSLYVAKVCDGSSGIQPARIAQVRGRSSRKALNLPDYGRQ